MGKKLTFREDKNPKREVQAVKTIARKKKMRIGSWKKVPIGEVQGEVEVDDMGDEMEERDGKEDIDDNNLS